MRATQLLRAGWRTLESFLTDYYRACGTTVAPIEATNPRHIYLCQGELLTLAEPQHPSQLKVVRGEIWVTDNLASGDLLLGPGATYDLPQNVSIVIEALEPAEIVLRPLG